MDTPRTTKADYQLADSYLVVLVHVLAPGVSLSPPYRHTQSHWSDTRRRRHGLRGKQLLFMALFQCAWAIRAQKRSDVVRSVIPGLKLLLMETDSTYSSGTAAHCLFNTQQKINTHHRGLSAQLKNILLHIVCTHNMYFLPSGKQDNQQKVFQFSHLSPLWESFLTFPLIRNNYLTLLPGMRAPMTLEPCFKDDLGLGYPNANNVLNGN